MITKTYLLGRVNIANLYCMHSGNKSELQARCKLLKKLLSYRLDNLMTLSKTELRSMSLQLSLPSGSDATKDDLIKNISDVMIHNQVDAAGHILSLVDNEDDLDV